MNPASMPVGARVRVRAAWPQGHCRTPHYLRGKQGVVVRRLGDYPNPEQLAYHRPGLPLLALYQVEFDSAEVWGERLREPPYRITADLFEHWLEPLAGEH
ncbi:MAG: nitrile hydratase subunit beta [Proteobacteria bacterium]|nr:nitrile hydratase subunit beta [Burkholderiales bacterium]